MNNKTIIFLGRAGSGKGTQIELLIKKLEQDGKKAFHVSTGNIFRLMRTGDSHTAELVGSLLDAGKLVNTAIANWALTDAFVENINGKEHVVTDGYPRTIEQAQTLDDLLDFYKRDRPVALHLKVSREEAFTRLKDRARSDDQDTQINERLDIFDQEVVPTIEWYKKNDRYTYIEIEGEGSVEDIHANIAKQILS